MSVPGTQQPLIYRLYVDDSGEKEYGKKTSRYFVYAGVVVAAGEEVRLAEELLALKLATFGRSDVEIKSNWLRHPNERRRRYLEPFGLTNDALDRFGEEVQSWMANMDGRFIGVAIDKPQVQAKYKTPFFASAIAYQFLLQRLELHMRGLRGTGESVQAQVTMDDMDGSSPKKNQWRDLLRTQHSRLLKDGCRFTGLRFENCAKTLRFGDSRQFELLQVADLLAYNVFRHFRDHGDQWDTVQEGEVPTYPRLVPMLKRFLHGPNHQWEGYGIVKFPRIHSGRMFLTAEELL